MSQIDNNYQKINLVLPKKFQIMPEYLTKIQKNEKSVQSLIRACRVEVWSKSNKACMHAYSGH